MGAMQRSFHYCCTTLQRMACPDVTGVELRGRGARWRRQAHAGMQRRGRRQRHGRG